MLTNYDLVLCLESKHMFYPRYLKQSFQGQKEKISENSFLSLFARNML